jgi:hypothetical protein
LIEGVKDMQAACESEKTKAGIVKEEGKERVSFGTNVSTDDESSASKLVKQDMHWLDMVVSKIQTKRVAMMNEQANTKRSVLKVQGTVTKKRDRRHRTKQALGML